MPRPHGGYPARLLPWHEKWRRASCAAAQRLDARRTARPPRRTRGAGGERLDRLAGAHPARLTALKKSAGERAE